MGTDREDQHSQNSTVIDNRNYNAELEGCSYTDLNLSNFDFEAAGQRLGDVVAAMTETSAEAQIDAANGLRGTVGRRPVAEDFEGLFTQEAYIEDVVGSEITRSPIAIDDIATAKVMGSN